MIERGVILAEHGGEIGSAHLFPHLCNLQRMMPME